MHLVKACWVCSSVRHIFPGEHVMSTSQAINNPVFPAGVKSQCEEGLQFTYFVLCWAFGSSDDFSLT